MRINLVPRQNLCLQVTFYRLWAASVIHTSVTTSSHKKCSSYSPWKPTPKLLKSKPQFCDGEACSFQRLSKPPPSELLDLQFWETSDSGRTWEPRFWQYASWILPETELWNTCFARNPAMQMGILQDASCYKVVKKTCKTPWLSKNLINKKIFHWEISV